MSPRVCLASGKRRGNLAKRSTAAALVCVAMAVSAGSQRHKTPPEDYSDKTVVVPEFAISVSLSPQADKRLRGLHETIKILAMFDGDPLPGQGHDNASMRDVYLGSDEKLVDSNNIAKFNDTKISQRHWNQLSNKDYYLTINVFSARKTYKDNLLSCGVPEARISTFADKTIEVHCWLIGESTEPDQWPDAWKVMN